MLRFDLRMAAFHSDTPYRAPFRLSPDPDFYFDSHGHHRAFAALRRGMAHPSGFTVISGEIGAGKTTIVRTVLRELESQHFAVAQITNTQLDAEELLRAIAIGFGVPLVRAGAAEVATSLRVFLVNLSTQQRRAVLVIDEAQNLDPEAFNSLVPFARRAAPRAFGMQICLVGQPALQTMMQTAPLAEVRKHMCVSCHLDPLERDETRAYVLHRLGRAGWQGSAGFHVDAFDEIYRWTEGVPRRINTLCSRLVATYESSPAPNISADRVADLARDERGEFGGAAIDPPRLPPQVRQAVSTIAKSKQGPLLFIVADLQDHLRAAALMSAFRDRDPSVPTRLVRVADDDSLFLSAVLFEGLDVEATAISLEPDGAAQPPSRELGCQLENLLRRTRPQGVVVFESSQDGRFSGAAAQALGIPVVHIATAGRTAASQPSQDATIAVTSGPAALRCCTDAGDPLVDSIKRALSWSRDERHMGARHRMVIPRYAEVGRYLLLLIENPRCLSERADAVALMAFLRGIGRLMPVVWLMRTAVERAFDGHGFERGIFGDRVCALRRLDYVSHVELLRGAACALSDAQTWSLEARFLGKASLFLDTPGQAAFAASRGPQPPMLASSGIAWHVVGEDSDSADVIPSLLDEGASARLVEHIEKFLKSAGSPEKAFVTARNRELLRESTPTLPSFRGTPHRIVSVDFEI